MGGGRRRQQSGRRSSGCVSLSSSAAEASTVKSQTPFMGEATGSRGGGGGGTEDSWSQLGSLLSARVGHRAAAVRAGEGRGTHSGGG